MKRGTLYIVPTPIGNLADFTIRASEVLASVDMIACEDTRHTKKLLNYYKIKKPLISYEKFSEASRVNEIMGMLEKGQDVALVSDSGTPAISDPGTILISRVRSEGIRVEALPGPCAFITAICASGFDGPFRFIGFFPRQKGLAKKEFLKISLSQEMSVFYESPARILKTLQSLSETLSEREICIAREISKIHEEYIIGSVHEVLAVINRTPPRGEIVVLVKGSSQRLDVDEDLLRQRAKKLIESGYTKKDILRVLTEETLLSRNVLYRMLIDIS